MKKFNALRILVIVFIAVVGFISCSEDNPSNKDGEVANLLLHDREDLLVTFRDTIMVSPEYIAYRSAMTVMIQNIGDAGDPPIGDRSDFQEWVDGKLIETEFATLNDAMDAYDDLAESYVIYRNEFQPFFESLVLLDEDDFGYVTEPEVVGEHPSEVASNPCSSGCFATFDYYYDLIEAVRAYNLAHAESEMESCYYEYLYWKNFNSLITTLNTCLEPCPK